MGLNLANYEELAREAVKQFWQKRAGAKTNQQIKKIADRGGRAYVTAGKNMDGFASLVETIVIANGIENDCIFGAPDSPKIQRHVTLPGFFRPVKDWDFLVIYRNKLLAAFEFKSQVGPSFGNNFNNRCEEAIGSATDLWIAYRERVYGDAPEPFLGYLMLLEDASESRSPVRIISNHFDPMPVFEDTSYAGRYEILCRRLVQERLYSAATLLLSSSEDGLNGDFRHLSKKTGLQRMVAGLAGHVATLAEID